MQQERQITTKKFHFAESMYRHEMIATFRHCSTLFDPPCNAIFRECDGDSDTTLGVVSGDLGNISRVASAAAGLFVIQTLELMKQSKAETA